MPAQRAAQDLHDDAKAPTGPLVGRAHALIPESPHPRPVVESVCSWLQFPPPLLPGGTVSLRFEALSAEGASALLLASVGVSWRFRLFRPRFRPKNGLPALSFSGSSGLLPFRPLVEKVSDLLAFLRGRFRQGSTLKRGRTGALELPAYADALTGDLRPEGLGRWHCQVILRHEQLRHTRWDVTAPR